MLYAYMAYAHELLDVPLDQGIPQIILKASCEYIHPAKWGDALEISAHITRFGSKSFDMEYVISLADTEPKLVAKGASTHGAFDYATDSTVPLSDAFKRRALAYQDQGEESAAREAVTAAA